MAAISGRRTILFKSLSNSSNYYYIDNQINNNNKWISTTIHLNNSWMDKIKGAGDKIKAAFTGQKPSQSLTLFEFADKIKDARNIGTFKPHMVGQSSEATSTDVLERKEAIIRCLGGFDNTGENILPSEKLEAAQKFNCTVAEVESTLATFTWAKEGMRKVEKLKEEGKLTPKNIREVQKLMGSKPMDTAQSNMAKSGKISRNALCPCGSKKRYKRCCERDHV